MSDIIEYGEWTDGQAAEEMRRAEQSKRRRAQIEEGSNVLRFMPPPKGRGPFTIVWKHYIPKPGSDDKHVVNCAAKMANARCPVCEARERMLASGNPYDMKAAERLDPVKRVYGCAVVLSSGLPPDELEPQVIELSGAVYDRMLALRNDPVQGVGDFTNPETGCNILVVRTGTGWNTRYPTVGTTVEGRHPVVNRNWLAQIKSTAQYGQLSSPEEMAEAVQLLSGASTPSQAMPMRTVTAAPQAMPAPTYTPAPAGPTIQGDLAGDDVLY